MQTPYIAEGKLPLTRHQDCIKAIYACKTAADFDNIPTWIEQYELPAKNRETMDTVIANQRRLLKVSPQEDNGASSIEADVPAGDPATNPPVTRAEELKDQYKDIDAENFKIETVGWNTEPVSVVVTTTPSIECAPQHSWGDTEPEVISDPLDAIPQVEPTPLVIETNIPVVEEEKPKRSRNQKKEWVQSVNNSSNIVLKRRINLPIDGVQYSNNEFGCEVSASTKEEAQALLEEIMDEFMSDSGLVRKSSMAEYLKAEFNKGVASVTQQAPLAKEVVEKVVEKIVYQRSPEDDLELRRYARVQLFMQALAKDPTVLPAMQRIKVEFERTNPRF